MLPDKIHWCLQAEVKEKCKQLRAVKGELDLRHAQVDDYKLSIRQMQVCQVQSLLVVTLWIENLILSCTPELSLKAHGMSMLLRQCQRA